MINHTSLTNQSISTSTVCNATVSNTLLDWYSAIQTEELLSNFPVFPWTLVTDLETDFPVLTAKKTISRPLISATPSSRKVCPYGDKPALLAVIVPNQEPQLTRSAYALSALRFKENPFPNKDSRLDNKIEGIPTVLQALYRQKSSCKERKEQKWLQLPSLQDVEVVIDECQQEMRSRYTQELVPLMNANPLDPSLHSHDLSPQLIHDLQQYVTLQNRPYLFFDLMQWLERDIVTRRWRSAQAGGLLSSNEALRLVMDSWTDKNGNRRKKSITCPIGVPLGYMQSVRRKNQPFITQEFAGHAHGAFNHWLQEHIWQRFYYRYPEQCQLTPTEFFKEIGRRHSAFADAIYELHMANVVNPANTNFWSILQFYLPFISPWP